MFITENMSDALYSPSLTNFKTVSGANLAALGLTAADKLIIDEACNDYVTAYNAHLAAKAAAEAAREAKDDQRATTRAVINGYAKQFRANLGIPDSLLVELEVAPHSTPGVKTAPTTPINTVATADGNGDIELKWNRNGNISGTIFQVEYKTSPSGAWTNLGSTNTRKFRCNFPAGSYVAFRVCAQRRGISSNFCTPVTLWATEPTETLQIAA